MAYRLRLLLNVRRVVHQYTIQTCLSSLYLRRADFSLSLALSSLSRGTRESRQETEELDKWLSPEERTQDLALRYHDKFLNSL
jgi:hypothetical protein